MMYDSILIYDQGGYFGQSEQVTSLLKVIKQATFKTPISISESQYRAGSIKQFNKIFYVKFGDENTSAPLLKDLLNTHKNICLLGNNMDKITLGVISYKGKSSDIVKVVRNNKEQGIVPGVSMNLIKVNNPKVQVITRMSDGRNVYPFSIKYNNILYFSSYYNNHDLNNIVYKDIKQYYNKTSVNITSKAHNVRVSKAGTNNFSMPVNILIVLVTAICISFLVIFLISARSAKKKLFKGR